MAVPDLQRAAQAQAEQLTHAERHEHESDHRDVHRPTVLRIKTARKTLMPMRTVRFAPSSTEVRTVS